MKAWVAAVVVEAAGGSGFRRFDWEPREVRGGWLGGANRGMKNEDKDEAHRPPPRRSHYGPKPNSLEAICHPAGNGRKRFQGTRLDPGTDRSRNSLCARQGPSSMPSLGPSKMRWVVTNASSCRSEASPWCGIPKCNGLESSGRSQFSTHISTGLGSCRVMSWSLPRPPLLLRRRPRSERSAGRNGSGAN